MIAQPGISKSSATQYCLGCLWKSADKKGPCFCLFFGAIIGCLFTSLILTIQTCSQNSFKNMEMRKKVDDYHFFIEGKVYSRKQRSLSEGISTCKAEKKELEELLTNSALDKEIATSQAFQTKPPAAPKKIAEEYTVRGKLLIAVLSRGMKAALKAKMIYYTWGMDAIKSNISLHFFVPPDENVTELTYFPYTRLSPASNGSKVGSMFETLEAIFGRYGTAYDWIFVVHDDVYVRVDGLMDLLSDLDPKGLVYLGHPSKRHPDNNSSSSSQFGLLPHEVYCSGGTGFVLSFATLKLLVPYLPLCMQAVTAHNEASEEQPWEAEEVEVGRCLSRTIGIQCSPSKEAYQSFTTDYTGKAADSPSDLWKDVRFQRALVVYPIHTFQAIRTFHYLYSWLRVRALHSRGSAHLLQPLVDACTLMPDHLVPRGMGNSLQYCRSQAHSCMPLEYHFYKQPFPDMEPYKPESRHDQPEWMYLDEDKIYINNNDHPVLGQTGLFSEKLRNLIHDVKMFLQKKNKMPVGGVKIRGGYFRENSHRGREIIVDIEMTNYTMIEGKMESMVIRPRVELVQPVPQMLSVEMETPVITDSLVIVVPLAGGRQAEAAAQLLPNRTAAFLARYAESILDRHSNGKLVLVAYGDEALRIAEDEVEPYRQRYTECPITVVHLSGEYSYLRTLKAAAEGAELRDLLYMADVDTTIRSDFIMRCRKTTSLGVRLYSAIPFQLYDPRYSYKMHERPKVPFISREAGYWDHGNYDHTCVYKADLLLAVKSGQFVQDRNVAPESSGLLIAGAMKQGLQTIRAPDPGLTRQHSPKLCSASMDQEAIDRCRGWAGRNLADRRDLAINMLQLESRLGLDSEATTTPPDHAPFPSATTAAS